MPDGTYELYVTPIVISVQVQNSTALTMVDHKHTVVVTTNDGMWAADVIDQALSGKVYNRQVIEREAALVTRMKCLPSGEGVYPESRVVTIDDLMRLAKRKYGDPVGEHRTCA